MPNSLDNMREHLIYFRDAGRILGFDIAPSYYDASYGRIVNGYAQKRALLYGTVASAIPDDAQVLDVACGMGDLAWKLGTRVEHYIGIDYSGVGIEKAEAGARKRKLDCEFYCMDFRDYDIGTFEYDTLVLMEILEHIYDDIEMIQDEEAGTRVVLTVPLNEGTLGDTRLPKSYPLHKRVYSPAGVWERYQWLFETVERFDNIDDTWLMMSGIRGE